MQLRRHGFSAAKDDCCRSRIATHPCTSLSVEATVATETSLENVGLCNTAIIPCVLICSFVLTGTQEDQDATDEKARKQAMNELVQSWMDRLQLISVIVKFGFYSGIYHLLTACVA